MPVGRDSNAPIVELEISPMRSERLLRGMHRVLSHDLPNQIVAVQGLLQLLSLEEASRLTSTGLEYVQRLHHAAGRTAEMVRFLKEMERLQSYVARRESVSLDTFARELQGELQRRYPKIEFEFAWQWNVPAVVGDSRVYLPALQELFVDQLDAAAVRCQISGNSRRRSDKIELAFSLTPALPAASVEPRMGTVLAGEWLGLLGATVEFAPPESGSSRFVILLPSR